MRSTFLSTLKVITTTFCLERICSRKVLPVDQFSTSTFCPWQGLMVWLAGKVGGVVFNSYCAGQAGIQGENLATTMSPFPPLNLKKRLAAPPSLPAGPPTCSGQRTVDTFSTWLTISLLFPPHLTWIPWQCIPLLPHPAQNTWSMFFIRLNIHFKCSIRIILNLLMHLKPPITLSHLRTFKINELDHPSISHPVPVQQLVLTEPCHGQLPMSSLNRWASPDWLTTNIVSTISRHPFTTSILTKGAEGHPYLSNW